MTQPHKITRQHAVVLATTLIILMVLILLSVTTLSGSSILTFVARNTQLKQVSFQRAESTIATAEADWDQTLSNCLNDLGNCRTDITPPMLAEITETTWSTAAEVNAHNGRYLVEYLGWRAITGTSDRFMRLYRITARASGPNNTSTTEVQTIFRKCVKQDGAACPNKSSTTGLR